MAGPLAGVRVVEVAGLGPAPFGCMVLADLGADVIVVDRRDQAVGAPLASAAANVSGRGRRSVAVDLKHPEGVDVLARLADGADVFVEGFRPGVAERLGFGPDVLRGRNPALVYARMTGWGQDGPLAARAGHDLNYTGLAGPLAHIGRQGQAPTPPLNLVSDFGGGGMLLALGVCAALVERARSGRGQVVDAAMVDGAALLGAPIVPAYTLGYFGEERGTNVLDSGAHFYEVYETADGQWMTVGALEAPFYANLLAVLGLDPAELPEQNDRASWPAMKERLAAVFRSRPQAEWVAAFADVDACVAPVRSYTQVADDEHLAARATYVELDGVVQPAPAPRFDRTPATLDRPPAPAGHHTDEILADLGFDGPAVDRLRQAGVVG
jgi:alpha-methylacyl-CoA racemase